MTSTLDAPHDTSSPARHLVCRGCGAITDVDCAVHYTPCLTPSDPHGFLVDEAEVTYWGLCPTCQGELHGDD